MSKLKALLFRWPPRYKLRCILRALELEARPWQIQYALGKSQNMPMGRQTGKTMAVILRALMTNTNTLDIGHIIRSDPDYMRLIPHVRDRFYRYEYDKCYRLCNEAGIPVPRLYYPPYAPLACIWMCATQTEKE